MPFQTLHHTRFAPEHHKPDFGPSPQKPEGPAPTFRFFTGVVYADMDAVAHDGTVDMGFRGVPVVLDGPVILDLLVLRFSLFPAQGGSPPASRTRVENQNDFRPPLCDLSITVVVVNAILARGCVSDRARKAVGLALQVSDSKL
jgi:hypothetical protein